MADDKKAYKLKNPIGLLLLLLLAASIFNSLANKSVNGTVGGNGGFWSNFAAIFNPNAGQTKPFAKVGAKVTANQGALVYDAAAGTPLSNVLQGTVGVISDGPVNKNGQNWWKVSFPDGTEGWMPESSFAVKPDLAPGQNVSNKSTLAVSDTPGGVPNGTTVPAGTKGKVIGGPVNVNGEPWVEVQYEDGTTGWVKANGISSSEPQKDIGSSVANRSLVTVYDESGVPIGMSAKGAEGTIIDGPVNTRGEQWWKVQYDDGRVGWVKSDDISALRPDFKNGSAVRSKGGTDVFDRAGGTVIANEPPGSTGSVIAGPVDVNGEPWVKVQYDDGVVGWVPSRSLVSKEVPLGVGSLVSAEALTDVYDNPEGKKIAQVSTGAHGTIVSGPTDIGNTRWWKVRYDDGTVGWVKEVSVKNAFTDTPFVDGRVTNADDVSVSAKPGGPQTALVPKGMGGKVLGNALSSTGEKWWKIQYDNGVTGWVKESTSTKNLSAEVRPISNGSPVKNVAAADLYNSPNGKLIGSEPLGASGTVVDGPQVVNGETFLNVEYIDGKSGWVKGKSLSSDEPYVGIGSPVVARDSTEVFDEAGGQSLGFQKGGAKGTVVRGPVDVSGRRWWQVNFKNSPSGWVEEKFLRSTGKKNGHDVGPPFFGPGFFGKLMKFVSTILSLFFATGVIYSTLRLTQIRGNENKRIKDLEREISPVKDDGKPKNMKWEKVLLHVESDNPNDWRQAILEADILLEEMMEITGHHGETLSDKLRAVEKSDFTTIDLAWEAHRVRNQIAHEGSDFLITQREAKRVIGLYRKVFEEFRFI